MIADWFMSLISALWLSQHRSSEARTTGLEEMI